MKASKTAKAAEDVGSGRKKKRKRLSGVRGRVLELLASGPMSSAQLVSAGGFSAASLYLNLKSLKKDGLVDTRRDGRSVVISLVAGGGAASPAAPARRVSRTARASGPATVPAYVPRDLAQALESLSHRLSPVARLDDKLLVLQQLSRSLQQPVAGLLQA
jgi:DNA-binding transcriptional ArsR family regulator